MNSHPYSTIPASNTQLSCWKLIVTFWLVLLTAIGPCWAESKPVSEVRLQRYNPNTRPPNTWGKYGKIQFQGYIAFQMGMIAEELLFCSKNIFRFAADKEEVSMCRQELESMLFDPAMNMAILLMTATSIKVNRLSRKALRPLLYKLLVTIDENGIPMRGPYKKALKITFDMLQHLSMGAGMMVQTSTASTWNAPTRRKCFAQIKKNLRESFASNNLDTHEKRIENEASNEVASQAVDQAMQTSACVEAYEYFMDDRNGTVSEIWIAMYSLGIASSISGVAFTIIKRALPAVTKFLPFQGLAAGPMILAEQMIGYIQRWLEPIITAWYHRRNSNIDLRQTFSLLVESMDEAEENDSFISAKTVKVDCKARNYKYRAKCKDGKDISFKVFENIKTYHMDLDYRREAVVNRFLESHHRWSSKTQNAMNAVVMFQKTMDLIYDLRDIFKNTETEQPTHKNLYAPIGKYKSFEKLSKSDFEYPAGFSRFSQQQLNELYRVMNQIRSRITLGSYDQLKNLRLMFEALDDALHAKNDRATFIHLFRIKRFIERDKNRPRFFVNFINTGDQLTAQDYKDLENAATSLITAYDSRAFRTLTWFMARSTHVLTESAGIVETMDEQEEAKERVKNGVNMEEDPLHSILQVNKDDSIPFYRRQKGPLRWEFKHGPTTDTIPSRILTHMACSDFSKIEYFFNPGRESQVVFPNILEKPDLMNCDYHNPDFRWSDEALFQDQVAFFNPNEKTTTYHNKNESIHKIYSYEGEEYIGLLDILTNPDIPLRWSRDEFESHWAHVLRPDMLRFALQLREDYSSTLKDFFSVSYDCDRHGSQLREEACEVRETPYDVVLPISDHELEERMDDFYFQRNSNKRYYLSLGLAESFADEARTYHMVASRFFGDDSELAHFFETYAQDIYNLVQTLSTDIPLYRFNPQVVEREDNKRKASVSEDLAATWKNSSRTSKRPRRPRALKIVSSDIQTFIERQELMEAQLILNAEDLSDAEVESRLGVDPLAEMFSESRFAIFSVIDNKINEALQRVKKKWPLQNPRQMDESLLFLSSFEKGRDIVAGQMIANLDRSLQSIYETIIEKYLKGEGMVHLTPMAQAHEQHKMQDQDE